MSREVKRVPMNFNWPIGNVWKGYINPYNSIECPSCGGHGLNEKTKELENAWYSLDDSEYVELGNGTRYNKKAWSNNLIQEEVTELVKHGRLMDFTHTWTRENGWQKKKPAYIPTAEEVNEWNKRGMGHDGVNRWICVEVRAKRLGFYGLCEFCEGEGDIFISNEIKKLHGKWKWIEPPKGKGWQMWETTSEGSPMSPVFETPEQLAQWLFDNKASSFGRDTSSYESWFSMITNGGHAISMVASKNGLVSGVDAVAEINKTKETK